MVRSNRIFIFQNVAEMVFDFKFFQHFILITVSVSNSYGYDLATDCNQLSLGSDNRLQIDNSCFDFIDYSGSTFDQALDQCSDNNGATFEPLPYLAMPKNYSTLITAADYYINSIGGSGFFVGVKKLSGSFKWIDGTPFNPTGVTPDSWCSFFTDPNGDCVFLNTQSFDASASCYDRFDCKTVPSLVFATCQMDLDYEHTVCVQNGWHPTPFGNCYAAAFTQKPSFFHSKNADIIPNFPNGASWFQVACAAIKNNDNVSCISDTRSTDPFQTIVVPKTVREIAYVRALAKRYTSNPFILIGLFNDSRDGQFKWLDGTPYGLYGAVDFFGPTVEHCVQLNEYVYTEALTGNTCDSVANYVYVVELHLKPFTLDDGILKDILAEGSNVAECRNLECNTTTSIEFTTATTEISTFETLYNTNTSTVEYLSTSETSTVADLTLTSIESASSEIPLTTTEAINTMVTSFTSTSASVTTVVNPVTTTVEITTVAIETADTSKAATIATTSSSAINTEGTQTASENMLSSITTINSDDMTLSLKFTTSPETTTLVTWTIASAIPTQTITSFLSATTTITSETISTWTAETITTLSSSTKYSTATTEIAITTEPSSPTATSETAVSTADTARAESSTQSQTKTSISPTQTDSASSTSSIMLTTEYVTASESETTTTTTNAAPTTALLSTLTDTAIITTKLIDTTSSDAEIVSETSFETKAATTETTAITVSNASKATTEASTKMPVSTTETPIEFITTLSTESEIETLLTSTVFDISPQVTVTIESKSSPAVLETSSASVSLASSNTEPAISTGEHTVTAASSASITAHTMQEISTSTITLTTTISPNSVTATEANTSSRELLMTSTDSATLTHLSSTNISTVVMITNFTNSDEVSATEPSNSVETFTLTSTVISDFASTTVATLTTSSAISPSWSNYSETSIHTSLSTEMPSTVSQNLNTEANASTLESLTTVENASSLETVATVAMLQSSTETYSSTDYPDMSKISTANTLLDNVTTSLFDEKTATSLSSSTEASSPELHSDFWTASATNSVDPITDTVSEISNSSLETSSSSITAANMTFLPTYSFISSSSDEFTENSFNISTTLSGVASSTKQHTTFEATTASTTFFITDNETLSTRSVEPAFSRTSATDPTSTTAFLPTNFTEDTSSSETDSSKNDTDENTSITTSDPPSISIFTTSDLQETSDPPDFTSTKNLASSSNTYESNTDGNLTTITTEHQATVTSTFLELETSGTTQSVSIQPSGASLITTTNHSNWLMSTSISFTDQTIGSVSNFATGSETENSAGATSFTSVSETMYTTFDDYSSSSDFVTNTYDASNPIVSTSAGSLTISDSMTSTVGNTWSPGRSDTLDTSTMTARSDQSSDTIWPSSDNLSISPNYSTENSYTTSDPDNSTTVSESSSHITLDPSSKSSSIDAATSMSPYPSAAIEASSSDPTIATNLVESSSTDTFDPVSSTSDYFSTRWNAETSPSSKLFTEPSIGTMNFITGSQTFTTTLGERGTKSSSLSKQSSTFNALITTLTTARISNLPTTKNINTISSITVESTFKSVKPPKCKICETTTTGEIKTTEIGTTTVFEDDTLTTDNFMCCTTEDPVAIGSSSSLKWWAWVLIALAVLCVVLSGCLGATFYWARRRRRFTTDAESASTTSTHDAQQPGNHRINQWLVDVTAPALLPIAERVPDTGYGTSLFDRSHPPPVSSCFTAHNSDFPDHMTDQSGSTKLPRAHGHGDYMLKRHSLVSNKKLPSSVSQSLLEHLSGLGIIEMIPEENETQEEMHLQATSEETSEIIKL